MKSFLGMLFTVVLFIVVVGGGAFIWYLSHTAEFSQKAAPDATETAPLQPSTKEKQTTEELIF